MTQQALDTPFAAELVDDEIVITGPNGFNGSLTLEAARASVENLQRVIGAADQAETYQKPLG